MNIEPKKVVESYVRNAGRGLKCDCRAILKLISSFLDPNSGDSPESAENVELRDSLYTILKSDKNIQLGQAYCFEDKKPRDDFFIIAKRECALTEDRIALIMRVARTLPTSEKDSSIVEQKLAALKELLESKCYASCR